MGIRSLLSLTFIVLLMSACQKVDPNVFMIGNDGTTPPLYPVITNPSLGRITGGSSEAVVSNGAYKLKGRVSFVPSHESQNGSYKLRGTVSF